MALDYSKLSDEELEAIANDDYSKLSDKTLNAIANDPGAKQVPAGEPMPDFTPQAVRTVAGGAAPVVQGAANVAGNIVGDWAKLGKIAYENVSPNVIKEFVSKPITNTAKLAGAYVEGHPYVSRFMEGTMKDAVGAVGRGAGAVGRGLVQGAVAPESLFLLPYQMAAYEQEKIKQDPYAPGLERNPYAMTLRGEAPTIGAAGQMNQRRAVVSMPIRGVTEEERKILEEDQRRRLEMLTRYEAAKRVLGPRQ